MTLSEQLKSLVEKATPGPWRKGKRQSCDIDIIGRPTWPCKRYGKAGEWDVAVVTELENTKEQAANASLIVTLVNNLPTILAALEAAENTPETNDAL